MKGTFLRKLLYLSAGVNLWNDESCQILWVVDSVCRTKSGLQYVLLSKRNHVNDLLSRD